RNQKVIEETPAPGINAEVRKSLWDMAERLTRALRYRSAGTVEFLYDDRLQEFFFLEVNTRLQVEHGVTEEVTGIDLVEWMLRLGAGELPDIESLRPKPRGVSIQARIYAEDPAHGFRPCAGTLANVAAPAGVRFEKWVENGREVPPFYDPMLAKIIIRAGAREAAVSLLRNALALARFDGLETNLDYLRSVVAEPEFAAGGYPTDFLSRIAYRPLAI